MAGAAFPALVLSLLGAATLTLVSAAWHAQVFLVGGESRGWRKPTAPNQESYNHWAVRNRFHVGDFLHFKYDMNDSVLVVTRDAYQLCVVDRPTLRFEGGDTRFRLDHSGVYYFISGAEDHCDAGQRMTLRVMVPQQQQGDTQPPAPAKAPVAMSPGDEDDEGGGYEPPPGARRRAPSPPGSYPGSGGSISVSRPPPHVAPGANGNKTSAAGSNSTHDASSSSSSPPPPLRGHRVPGSLALAALLLILPA